MAGQGSTNQSQCRRQGGDKHCARAYILAHFRQRMMHRACQIHNGFDGGVDELGSEYHRNGQHNDSPIDAV